MATNFPQTLGADQGAYAIPPELLAQLAAIERRRQQPQAPTYTPEQIAQRRGENEQQYNLGLLGGMASDEGMNQTGGQVLKKALADRQQRITERGATDPLSGQFTYSPDYLAQRDDAQEAGIQNRIAQGRQQWDAGRQSAAENSTRDRERAADRRELVGLTQAGRTEPLIAVMGPGGPTLVPRSQAAGMAPALTPGATNASEDERKAAGWVSQAKFAFRAMGEAQAADAKAAAPTLKEKALGYIPKVGEDLAYSRMTPARSTASENELAPVVNFWRARRCKS
jgi:hypothetical protein